MNVTNPQGAVAAGTTRVNSGLLVLADHPSWAIDGGHLRRAMIADGRPWVVSQRQGRLVWEDLAGEAASPATDVFVAGDGLAGGIPALAAALAALGPVVRVRNADLWDAVVTAVLRQVIRAPQARKLYRAFCQAHGRAVELPQIGTAMVSPAAETVGEMSDEDFARLGLKFHRDALRHAATAYLAYGPTWRALLPADLVTELCAVQRIGPWTARAAVADLSNDFALYPYADLAVRTWARRAAPEFDWPTDERAFGQLWRDLAGENLSTLTLLTLAWGHKHAQPG